MENNKFGIKIHISGKVQGVYFRAETQRLALSMNLTGFVRNLEDGRVEIEAEGEKEDLAKLVEWVRRGPELAQVTEIEVDWINPSGKYESFEVK